MAAGRPSSKGMPVEDYKEGLKQKVDDLIRTGVPEKIMELDNILKSHHFAAMETTSVVEANNLSSVDHRQDGPPLVKKIKLEDTATLTFPTVSRVRCNKQLTYLTDLLKRYIQDLLEDANMLKMWLTLNIPKIEGGDNFGVEIQEEILSEITSVETDATENLDQATDYYNTRGCLAAKVCKYPDIEDYRHALRELDEQHFLNVHMTLIDIRNRYSSLHDIILKNINKIVTPRSGNRNHLY